MATGFQKLLDQLFLLMDQDYIFPLNAVEQVQEQLEA
jgi:hypothetical protein